MLISSKSVLPNIWIPLICKTCLGCHRVSEFAFLPCFCSLLHKLWSLTEWFELLSMMILVIMREGSVLALVCDLWRNNLTTSSSPPPLLTLHTVCHSPRLRNFHPMVSHSVLSSSKTPNRHADKLGLYLNFVLRVAKRMMQVTSKNNAMCENVPRGFCWSGKKRKRLCWGVMSLLNWEWL